MHVLISLDCCFFHLILHNHRLPLLKKLLPVRLIIQVSSAKNATRTLWISSAWIPKKELLQRHFHLSMNFHRLQILQFEFYINTKDRLVDSLQPTIKRQLNAKKSFNILPSNWRWFKLWFGVNDWWCPDVEEQVAFGRKLSRVGWIPPNLPEDTDPWVVVRL